MNLIIALICVLVGYRFGYKYGQSVVESAMSIETDVLRTLLKEKLLKDDKDE